MGSNAIIIAILYVHSFTHYVTIILLGLFRIEKEMEVVKAEMAAPVLTLKMAFFILHKLIIYEIRCDYFIMWVTSFSTHCLSLKNSNCTVYSKYTLAFRIKNTLLLHPTSLVLLHPPAPQILLPIFELHCLLFGFSDWWTALTISTSHSEVPIILKICLITLYFSFIVITTIHKYIYYIYIPYIINTYKYIFIMLRCFSF